MENDGLGAPKDGDQNVECPTWGFTHEELEPTETWHEIWSFHNRDNVHFPDEIGRSILSSLSLSLSLSLVFDYTFPLYSIYTHLSFISCMYYVLRISSSPPLISLCNIYRSMRENWRLDKHWQFRFHNCFTATDIGQCGQPEKGTAPGKGLCNRSVRNHTKS